MTVLSVEQTGPTPQLLIEVPHGATEQHHYDTLAAQMKSVLPDRLEKFFWVNTDVGAHELAMAVAARVPAIVVRCLVPRTLVDVNRRVGGVVGGQGMTPALPPYITDPDDRSLLLALHQQYTTQVEALYEAHDLPALIVHSYAPRSVSIDVDVDIVTGLERAYEDIESCPLRPEIDLITTTPSGVDLSPPGLADRVVRTLAAHDLTAARNQTYPLHPDSMGAVWSGRWPGRTLCLEVRRDVITQWKPFTVKAMRHDVIDRIADCLAAALPPGDGPADL